MPQDEVTQLPEIVVTGQRRKDETYSFPSPPDPLPPIVDEIGPDDGSSDHPCGTAEGAREWNADARIAAALRQMQDDADDPLLDARERSIVVAYNPATGETCAGNMLVGEPFQGEVGFDLAGIDPGTSLD